MSGCNDCKDGKLCHYHERHQPKKYVLKRTPLKPSQKKIKPRSDKRAKQERGYNKKRKDYLNKYSVCQAGLAGCTKVATTIHHLEGRIGALLTDTDNFIALCMNCHVFVENHPKEAKELNLSKNRII